MSVTRSDSGRFGDEPGPSRFVVLVVAHGAVSALQTVLAQLPSNLPAALIVLTRSGTGRERPVDHHLSAESGIVVSPGEEGVLLRHGHAYAVPAESGLVVDGDGRLARAAPGRRRASDPPSEGLLDSLSHRGARTVAVALTPLDAPEAEGFRRIREEGGHTVALDEAAQPWAASSPVHEILPIDDIGGRILALLSPSRSDRRG